MKTIVLLAALALSACGGTEPCGELCTVMCAKALVCQLPPLGSDPDLCLDACDQIIAANRVLEPELQCYPDKMRAATCEELRAINL